MNLDDFFQPSPDTNQEGTVTLVLKFSPDDHRAVMTALKAHGKSSEQAILKVLGLK